MFKDFIIIALSLMGPAAFAQQDLSWDDEFSGQNAIKHIAEERIYLNMECIELTDEGIFFSEDGRNTWVQLPALFSDANGCFVTRLDQFLSGRIEIWNRCKGCNQQYIVTCKNPDCPLRQAYLDKKEGEKKQK